MQRLTALLTGCALVLAAGQLPALHVHAYTGHAHADHQHGPALHGHGHGHDAAHDGHPVPAPAPHVESCDPSAHAVSLTFVCETAPPTHVGDGECVTPAGIDRTVRLPSTIEIRDTRVHGPPGLTQASPRSPPASTPA